MLINTRRANVTNEFLEIVVVFSETSPQFVKQFFVDRWVGYSNVVDLIDDAFAKEVCPNDVAKIGRKIWILWRCKPVCHHDSSVFAFDIGHFSTKELRSHHLVANKVSDVAATAVVDNQFTWVFATLSTDL